MTLAHRQPQPPPPATLAAAAPYPSNPADRDAWVRARRAPRPALDPCVPNGAFVENERTATGDIASVTTLLLRNRECPWHCVMCDLWQHALTKLNKRMTLAQFEAAAAWLRRAGIPWRAFVLVAPPFLAPDQALPWAVRSAAFAFGCGASAVCLIPTRRGNGALEVLAAEGGFAEPPLATLETAVAEALCLQRGLVFADLWDLERFAGCPGCFAARRERLRQVNLTQTLPPPVACDRCSNPRLPGPPG